MKPSYISQKRAVAICRERIGYSGTWFKNRLRPALEARGAVIVIDYTISHTVHGSRYLRRGVRIDEAALHALLDEVIAGAERLGTE